ncbi:MAG: SMC-Scp complex subunit ScpB [Planctomycetia bacterium]|nr:SMC-Scp complex subunit ScpB [Planctomycetia bacterium]
MKQTTRYRPRLQRLSDALRARISPRVWGVCSQGTSLGKRSSLKKRHAARNEDALGGSDRIEPSHVAQQRQGGGSEAEMDSAVRTPQMLRVEAILFLSREPLNARRLAQLAGIPSEETLPIIAQLNRLYDSERRAFRILEFAGGYHLRTRPQFTPWLRRLCREQGVEGVESPEIRLSPPAMETLSIVAYRQPIIRAEIEAIRGVQCGELLRLLLSKDLIRISGRSTELGRPRLYKTTKKFLEVFGLKSLAQLPKIDGN